MEDDSGGLSAVVRGYVDAPRGRRLGGVALWPCTVSTTVDGVRVQIEEHCLSLREQGEDQVQAEREIEFPLLLRGPGWSRGTSVTCEGAAIRREGGYWSVTRKWEAATALIIDFHPSIREVPA